MHLEDSGTGCIRGTTCPTGEYLDYWSKACKECSEGCADCDDAWGDCVTCSPGYQLDDDDCIEAETPIECKTYQYRTQSNTCESCGEHCPVCAEFTGDCLECDDATYVNMGYGCVCPEGYTDRGNGCERVAGDCPRGSFYSWDGDCQMCGSKCSSCNDWTGTCNECQHISYIAMDKDCVCPEGTLEVGGLACMEDVMPPCPAGQFRDWDKSCSNCARNCDACEDNFGTCITCSHSSYIIHDQDCECPEGWFDNGSSCSKEIGTCEAGFFLITSDNMCAPCVDNCVTCTDETGVCESCAEGFILHAGACIKSEGDECVLKYGPPDAPVGCRDTAYSTERLLPPYDDDAVSVDWREWGVVNPIDDQKHCGSCYAFSATSAAETMYAINHGELYKLSQQQLVDC